MPPQKLSPELLRLAAQFHSYYRGVFLGMIPGSARYEYFDPGDPFTRLVPPPLVTVERVTQHFLVGTGPAPAYSTVVVDKLTRAAVVVRGAKRLHVDDVVEAPDKTLWILGERVDTRGDRGDLLLFRGDNALPPQTLTRSSERSWWNSRLALTRSGQLAAAWIEGGAATAGRVSLRLIWMDAAGHERPAIEVDAVTLPPSYADLCVRTGANIVLAADSDTLAIAWRPLAPPAGAVADTGDVRHPPSVVFPATVRIVAASPGTKPRVVSQYPTRVQPLGFTTGIGPWALDPGGAWGLTLDGRAVFLWLDPAGAGRAEVSLVAARLHDPKPTVLVRDSSDTLWVPSPAGATATTVVLNGYHSARDFRRFELSCVGAR